MKFLSDTEYRMLVTIPEVYTTKLQNQWMVEVWAADKIFNYMEPFLFTDYFNHKMSVDEFSVLFQIIQNFSVTNLSKDFDISKLYDYGRVDTNLTRL